eukprot:3309381-Rhodomonas_salina.1
MWSCSVFLSSSAAGVQYLGVTDAVKSLFSSGRVGVRVMCCCDDLSCTDVRCSANYSDHIAVLIQHVTFVPGPHDENVQVRRFKALCQPQENLPERRLSRYLPTRAPGTDVAATAPCYAIPGTLVLSSAICLRAYYAISSTDPYLSATRCPVLSA